MARTPSVLAMTGHTTASKIENCFLCALPAPVMARLLPALEPVELKRGRTLGHLGAPQTNLYFVDRGLVSLVRVMLDGRMVEVGAIGPEGISGAEGLWEGAPCMLEAMVQVPGHAHRLPARILRELLGHDPRTAHLLQAYVQALVGQIAQTAACNRLHTLEERFARWLLIAGDAAGADAFALTHEFLGTMLGVRRASVTLVAGEMQARGLVICGRGQIEIRDRPGLEGLACECYRTARDQYERLYGARVPARVCSDTVAAIRASSVR
ncbi:MAG: Crp/Fnr family transcriptional regulator [Alphaproteobacteria bacterium]|nr:Crp/Fnr family transcriptional regulator [Alphaproteobacteria bacterium]